VKISRAIVLSSAAGVAIYVAISVAIGASTGWGKVAAELGRFSFCAAAWGFALAAANHLLRFAKWEHYLRRPGVRIAVGYSLRIFLSRFSLTVTPGKVGAVRRGVELP
jgi:hypothetical protein